MKPDSFKRSRGSPEQEHGEWERASLPRLRWGPVRELSSVDTHGGSSGTLIRASRACAWELGARLGYRFQSTNDWNRNAWRLSVLAGVAYENGGAPEPGPEYAFSAEKVENLTLDFGFLYAYQSVQGVEPSRPRRASRSGSRRPAESASLRRSASSK